MKPNKWLPNLLQGLFVSIVFGLYFYFDPNAFMKLDMLQIVAVYLFVGFLSLIFEVFFYFFFDRHPFENPTAMDMKFLSIIIVWPLYWACNAMDIIYLLDKTTNGLPKSKRK